eukprot:CAMPEP_0117002188 /NCGR_PEP_ID=MMETSP0472-20121206/3950_1 /TAXON_ID=693140 ORGANISM="Tiarina fusus, Strain LIS" /NCGR_SAMPLE_ID=MMETSP0472 /ASSEMBLY_ACC=CAM_ASM_000603 /LENGTH=321 /DNA_ID=CAMNT_0004702471 /DNA_START=160 /DNA_END=1125 /DNA_ORIENTATION=+
MTSTTFQEKTTTDLRATFQKCLKADGPFENDDDKAICRQMVEAMPDYLVEHAANTSYAYWYLAQNPNSTPSEETKISVAMREARRHLSYMSGDYETAQKNFVESCEYRKEHKLDLLRVCFDKSFVPQPDDAKRCQEMADLVRSDMNLQYVVMRGKDRGNRAVMIKYPRIKPGTVEEGYVMSQIYMAERSIAATEFMSLGTEERSSAIFDYNGFDSANSPPFKMQVAAATTVQKLFPERLQMLVMISPPFWLRTLLNMLTPLLSSTITQRIKHATGEEEKEAQFSAMMDPEHAPQLLLKAGKLKSPMSLGALSGRCTLPLSL